MGGFKDDSGKLRYDLLPVRPIQSLIRVLQFGAEKYEPNNWQLAEDPNRLYYNAAMRHLEAWRSGESNDGESGLPHLAHALCCVLILLWFHERKDDD